MGVYNPHVPYVLGQEWAPIRNENYEFNPDATVRETGYGFTLATSRQLNNTRFYTNTLGGRPFQNHCAGVNIYSRGREDLSGPIRKVVIPCNNGAITGGPGGTFMTLNNAATLAECLASPGDFKYVEAKYNTSPGNAESGRFNCFFAINDFLQTLQGKRILNVTVLYSGRIIDHSSADGGGSSIIALYTGKNQQFQPTFLTYQSIVAQGTITYGIDFTTTNSASDSGILGSLNLLGGTINVPTQAIQRMNLGDFDPLPQRLPASTGDLVPGPWSLTSLQRLDARNGISSFIQLLFQVPIGSYDFFQTSTVIWMDYVALEVTFCEETRVAAGARFCQYANGLNFINMTDLNLNFNPIIAAGDYTATLGWLNPGDRAFTLDDLVAPYPQVNAAREKYALNSMPGLQVNIPFPLNDHIGDAFTKETTHVIPQISLHASGGGAPFVEPHVYGRQIAAQIYGNVTASQNLLDSAIGGNASFPQVRYYARRFGNTTIPLTLTGTSPTVSGSSASIAVSDFDALPEIIDGWKEINLRFNNIPVMGAGVTPTWQWSATSELAGNRWEVMGAMAPAVSGGGNSGQATLNPYTNPAPVTSQLSTATYGQPSAGSTVNMTWLPGFSPPVSATTADPWTDAVLMFSQDMPTVTGFTLVQSNQALTGVSLNCVSYPWYVPTSMAYNQLTWTATSSSVPVSGFAYYELQRQDTISTDWFTIAQLTSPSASSFKDYEARVGIQSSYRIRSVNALLFAGPWSSTISGSFAAPGVTGLGMGANARALLFTSNSRQNGSRNLAYSIAADNSGSEAFNFPEAGFTQFQFMYGRDYQTAFRPRERGGVTFQRSVLVQAAAIPAPTLADFTSLRDLAWDSLPYVCVRDEDGNRWLANVAVPQSTVKGNNRTIYIADLTITEVTNTPAIVVI